MNNTKSLFSEKKKIIIEYLWIPENCSLENQKKIFLIKVGAAQNKMGLCYVVGLNVDVFMIIFV